jgi:hypothetical protein
VRRLAVAAVLTLFAGSADAAETAAEIGAKFCAARLADEAAMRALLSPSLLLAIAAAEAKNEPIAKAHPDEKPPLGDGVPYQSFPDAAPACETGAKAPAEGGETVEIKYLFPETPDANWTDRILVKAGKIDDILFAEDGGGGTLTEALVTMFEGEE